jgi:mRNA interferase HigB
MWVVSLKRLRQFWATHERAEIPLRGWFTVTSAAEWGRFADLRVTFPSADAVGSCTVFNVGGNNYRLIARIFYTSHKVYVLRVMTHADHDREDWATQCGCYNPPPRPRKKRHSKRRKPS